MKKISKYISKSIRTLFLSVVLLIAFTTNACAVSSITEHAEMDMHQSMQEMKCCEKVHSISKRAIPSKNKDSFDITPKVSFVKSSETSFIHEHRFVSNVTKSRVEQNPSLKRKGTVLTL